jgi:hypothetical protein
VTREGENYIFKIRHGIEKVGLKWNLNPDLPLTARRNIFHVKISFVHSSFVCIAIAREYCALENTLQDAFDCGRDGTDSAQMHKVESQTTEESAAAWCRHGGDSGHVDLFRLVHTAVVHGGCFINGEQRQHVIPTATGILSKAAGYFICR